MLHCVLLSFDVFYCGTIPNDITHIVQAYFTATGRRIWHHIATQIWVNIDSGNGLLPDGTKPLPEPILTSHEWGSMAFTWEQFSQWLPKQLFGKMSLKIILSELLPYFPWTNELNASHHPTKDWWCNHNMTKKMMCIFYWIQCHKYNTKMSPSNYKRLYSKHHRFIR